MSLLFAISCVAPAVGEPAETKTPRLVVQGPIDARGIVFSPDGELILVSGKESVLLHRATGRELRRMEMALGGADFSPDGQSFALGQHAGVPSIYNTRTGQRLRKLQNPFDIFSSTTQSDGIAYSASGKFILSWGQWIEIWDAGTGKHRQRLGQEQGNAIAAAGFSPDGKYVYAARLDGTTVCWEWQSGNESFRKQMPSMIAGFDATGRELLFVSREGTVSVRSVADGTQIRSFDVLKAAQGASVSRDGKILLVSNAEACALYDTDQGRVRARIAGKHPFLPLSRFQQTAFSPDGRFLAAKGGISPSSLASRVFATTPSVSAVAFGIWDMATGELLIDVHGGAERRSVGNFSRDGKTIFLNSIDRWNCETGRPSGLVERDKFDSALYSAFAVDGLGTKVLLDGPIGSAQLRQLPDFTILKTFDRLPVPSATRAIVYRVGLSADGRYALIGNADLSATLWDVTAGKLSHRFPPRTWGSFSPDSSRLFADGAVWNLASMKRTHEIPELADRGTLLFSNDSQSLVSVGETTYAWRIGDEKWVKNPDIQRDALYWWGNSQSYSPDGRFQLRGDELWDARDEQQLCRLVNFEDGSWAVVDPHGRYDASNGGDVEGLHWVVDNEPIELQQLKKRYYEPGLLAKLLGFNTERLRDVGAFNNVELYPDVDLASAADEAKIAVEFDDTLGLAAKVNARLRGTSARGRNPPFVYVDTAEFPDAFRLAGRYTVEGDSVTVTVHLFKARQRVAHFEVAGGKENLDDLVTKIVEHSERRLEGER